jgi:hypothetical protein
LAHRGSGPAHRVFETLWQTRVKRSNQQRGLPSTMPPSSQLQTQHEGAHKLQICQSKEDRERERRKPHVCQSCPRRARRRCKTCRVCYRQSLTSSDDVFLNQGCPRFNGSPTHLQPIGWSREFPGAATWLLENLNFHITRPTRQLTLQIKVLGWKGYHDLDEPRNPPGAPTY